jgi:hypothetical protein
MWLYNCPVAYHPVNLALRFALELVGLYALGYWGWVQHTGPVRYLLALGLPLAAAFLWGTFRAIEPVAPQKIPVVVPGIYRLALEIVFFGVAIWALIAARSYILGAFFGLAVVLHHLLSLDRISWLLKKG